MNIQIDRESRAPLYLQLARCIREMIARGELNPGDRLPTVRALFNETGLSDGTIRHAYELLSREGTLSLIQGKGTFVSDRAETKNSREARAMAAIDQMIDELSNLGMGPREIRLYVSVKLSQREDARPLLPVAMVDCNSESLNATALQLCAIPGVELTEYLLDDVRRAPRELLGSFSLVITTQTHYQELRALMGDREKLCAGVVLSPSPDTLIALARVKRDALIGIYCRTSRFAEIVRNGINAISRSSAREAGCLLAGSGQNLEKFVDKLDLLIVSPDYLAYADAAEQAVLSDFARRGGRLLPYHHQLDKGSLMYVEERIRALRA